MTLPIWNLLEQVFTVETLMTPRQELTVWERGTDLDEVLTKCIKHRFDFIPVTEQGRIVAVLKVDQMDTQLPLTDRWLVSRDTGIPHLLDLIVATGHSGLFVFHRQEVIGMVTPADLNKMPARAYIYHLVGELEVGITKLIQTHFDGSQGLKKLSKNRRAKIEKELTRLIEGNADVDITQTLNLSDLINIIVKTQELRTLLKFKSRTNAEDVLNGLTFLRNDTMHVVRPLIEQVPQDLNKLQERINRAISVVKTIKQSLKKD